MAGISFQKLVSRDLAVLISDELDLAGVKVGLEKFFTYYILGAMGLFVGITAFLVIAMRISVVFSAIVGIGAAVFYLFAIYFYLELLIEQRKTFIEGILPDFLQIVAANVRSGIALDKALVFSARPEFKFFSDDIKTVSKSLYAGETLQNTLVLLGKRYRSGELQHTIRMINEAIQFGGGMTDLLNQIAKDLRSQQIIQKEISGQLFMYTIFIAFAALIGAPTLYALTTQMITVTDSVWAGILKQNPGGLPTAGISFLKPSPPKITITQYHDFALTAIIIITGFAAFIVASISTGSPLRGLRYLPIFIIVGLVVFSIVSSIIGGIFGSISGA